MKKNLLFSAILMMGLAIAGCGSVPEEYENNIIQQNDDANRKNSGMEADAPKSSENQNVQNKENVQEGVGNNQVTNNGNTVKEEKKDSKIEVDKTEITEAEAKNIALMHAQISESEVKRLSIVKERDDGRQIFDIDFSVGNKEYDYDIDLYTGEILNIDLDIDDDFNFNQNTTVKDNQQNTQQNNQSNEQTSSFISKEEAIAIVLKKVAGATEKNVEIELDEDDGKWQYEGEIHYQGIEYEFEINAKNGKIIEWSEDVDD